MARSSTPQLPGCEPLPLKYKEMPVFNGDGAPLKMCSPCAGSGMLCSGSKVIQDKSASPPHTVYKDFTGAESVKYRRQGWSVTSRACAFCGGAGLLVEGSK